MGDAAHWIDLSFGVIVSLTATIFVGTCGIFLMFLKSLETKTDAAIDSFSKNLEKTTAHFSEKFDEITECVVKVGTDLQVLIERNAAQEKRIDRLDFRKAKNES